MVVPIDTLQLEAHLLTIDLLQSMFPLPSELFLFPESAETLAVLRSLPSPTDLLSTPIQDELRLILRIDLTEEDAVFELDIRFPLKINVDSTRPGRDENKVNDDDVVADPSKSEHGQQHLSFAPTVTLLEPSWLSHASFSQLTSQVLSAISSNLSSAASTSPSFSSTGVSSATIVADKDDPTSAILQLVEEIKNLSQEYTSSSTALGSVSSSEAKSTSEGREELEGAEMSRVRDALICVSKMHHIVNQPKLRKLKALAVSSGASGFVKSGRPGIILYEIGSKEELAKFLEGVRSLKYLEFHHLTSEPLFPSSSNFQGASQSVPNPKSTQMFSQPSDGTELLNEGKPGLIELDEVKDLLAISERVGRREWFREAIGMSSTGKKTG